jgi:hypothetical protein
MKVSLLYFFWLTASVPYHRYYLEGTGTSVPNQYPYCSFSTVPVIVPLSPLSLSQKVQKSELSKNEVKYNFILGRFISQPKSELSKNEVKYNFILRRFISQPDLIHLNTNLKILTPFEYPWYFGMATDNLNTYQNT